MPNMPGPEVQQLDVIAVNEQHIVTLASFENRYKATAYWQEDKPLKEKDVLIITNCTMSSVFTKRYVNGQLEEGGYNLVFDVI
jgi:hypothetical protein